MKLRDHVFCITAYKDFSQLSSLLLRLSPYCKCYIHIDKRVSIPKAFMKKWSMYKNIQIIQTQRIFWGSYRHVLAVMDLLSMIDVEFKYVHIISENTLPIVSKEDFLDFFDQNPNKNYLEMTLAIEQDPELKRLKRYYFQYLYNTRSRFGWRIEKYIVGIQKCFNIQQNVQLRYKGYLYCHLSAAFIEWVIQHKKECIAFLYSIKNVYVPEEYFFQNLIIQSPYKDTVVNDALIFDIWDKPERGMPALLEIKDYSEIQKSGKIFARKFSSRYPEIDNMFGWD